MQDHFYLRLSQKELFDILYFTPALTGIYNLGDHSFSLSPELVYTGITNLEMRLKGTRQLEIVISFRRVGSGWPAA
jgi:hypothetical protein